VYQDEPYGIDDATCVRVTDDGACINSPFFGEETWIPRKGIHEDSDIQDEGDEGTLLVEGWLARDRGWSED
jgi:hypothetical protein